MRRAVWLVLAGALFEAVFLQTVLEGPVLGGHFVSNGLWQRLVGLCGGNVIDAKPFIAEVPLLPLWLLSTLFSVACWMAGGAWISRRPGSEWRDALHHWGVAGWLWWLLPLVWEALRLAAILLDVQPAVSLLSNTPEMWQTTMAAGWMTTFVVRACPARSKLPDMSPARSVLSGGDNHHVSRAVWTAMAAYFLCFGAMNWLLYESLLVPHGDSAMYEEHLWNLLHGKGFRSYLDNGRLFLGEHVQVIHLLLIPLYILWPSHILLELCQSLALAAGAIPVFWIARRHTGSPRTATLLACAYLLYFPMQFLDIAIDFKTFRPNSFEIPLLLFALDALERTRYRRFLTLLVLTLLCQEDAAVVIAPLGVWIVLSASRSRAGEWIRDAGLGTMGGSVTDSTGRGGDMGRRVRWLGTGLALFGTAYVILVITVILPWFRGGQEVHYTHYFSRFGSTSGEIVRTLWNHPRLLVQELVSVNSIVFALALLLPAGLLPLLSPCRLAVAAPLFGVLCLNEISTRPLHHFHAPLVPIVFWAAAAGLGNVPPLWNRLCKLLRRKEQPPNEPEPLHRFPADRLIATGKSLPATESPQAGPPLPAPVADAGSVRHDTGEPVRCTGAARPGSLGPIDTAAVWCVATAAALGFFIGLSPVSVGFWDPSSRTHWRKLYLPGERAKRFPAAFALVPRDSRVASTDYVHPRFTHHDRSYDYSDYRPIVPPDAEYIVIDTQDPYSITKRPSQVKEYRDHPDEWELLPDATGGYFIVLRRRR